ncbi:MAG: hypothetical protein WDZ51_03895 [Pirellulaceae bacterium]
MNWNYLSCGLALLMVLGQQVGCGNGSSGPTRYEVTGTVTHNGAPVPYGEITFAPDGSKGNQGPGAVVTITNGTYQVDRERGVIGGPHIVSITGYTAMPDGGAVSDVPTPQPMQLFPPYSESISLPTDNTTQDFQVPGRS